MPAFFIPARSSRHRTACCALYKALLRQAPKVPLPNEFLSKPWDVHPIKYLIRKNFGRNKADTSPRLVVSALNNGYKFLAVLSRAEATASPEYQSILSFLQTHRPRTTPAPLPERPSTAPGPDTIPLLTRIPRSKPGETATYVPTARPRPLAELKGRRRVPTFVTDAMGIPFLRIGKPQSPVLSRVLRQKVMKRSQRAQRMHDMLEDETWFAGLEDKWEGEVDKLMAQKGKPSGIRNEATFKGAMAYGTQYVHEMLTAEKKDMISRGKALLKIVEGETTLAKKEKQDRMEAKAKRREEWLRKSAE